MSYVSLGRENELWFPLQPVAIGFVQDTGTYTMDASGEYAAFMGRMPRAGTIDRFAVNVSAITNAPDNGMRLSFQNFGATGLPDGSVDQSATIASGSLAVGWNDPGAFDSSRSVARGDYVAFVVDFPSFVASDSVALMSTYNGLSVSTVGFPYGVLNGTKQTQRILQIAVHYTDDGGFWIPMCIQQAPLMESRSTANLDNASSPNVVGNAVMFPWGVKLNKVIVQTYNLGGAWSDCDLVVLDNVNSEISRISMEGNNYAGINAGRPAEFILEEELELAANTLYRVVLAPTSGDNVTCVYGTQIAAFAPHFAAGNVYMTESNNGGSTWTNYNNGVNGYRWLEMCFGLSAFDDGAGGGNPVAASIFGGGIIR